MPDFFDILSLRFSAVLPQAMAGLAVAGAFWLLARFVGSFIMRFQDRVAEDRKALLVLLVDVLGWSLFIIGVIAGLGTAGVNVTALVTGLGLTGFAVSLAMKDVLSNIIAGVLIMLFRPFGRGDKVRIDKFQGEVRSVDLRHTTLQSPGAKVLIPNALAYSQIVVVLLGDAAETDQAGTVAAAAVSAAVKANVAAAPAVSIKAAAKPTGIPTGGA